jgi:hypothetical protein
VSSGAGRLAIQVAGIGRMEAQPPGVVDGTRFEGRFVIYATNGPDGPVFGADVPLFDDDAVAAHGRGPQSAHLVCVRSGYVLEGFVTSSGDMAGHTVGRTSSSTRWKVYFDPSPDGTRRFDDRASFTSGQLVATYAAEELFQIDSRAEVFDTRVNYSVIDSVPFELHGVVVDLGTLAPRLAELSHGHPASSPATSRWAARCWPSTDRSLPRANWSRRSAPLPGR